MALEFLKQTPDQALRYLLSELKVVNPSFDPILYQSLSSDELSEMVDDLNTEERILKENNSYGKWLYNPKFNEIKLLKDTLNLLCDKAKQREIKEVLVPGFTYYKDVAQFGPILTGKKCLYLNENKFTNWVNFKTTVLKEKTLTVLRHSDDEIFNKIYMEAADGKVDFIEKVDLNHIFESSTAVQNKILRYCDMIWSGPWPWEATTPLKLTRLIEERTAMRKRQIAEMRLEMSSKIKRLFEEDMQKFELVSVAQDMASTVDGMISNLGKISSNGIEAVAQARATGNDQVASTIEELIGEPLNHAGESLSNLKAKIQQTMNNLQNGDSGNTDDMHHDMDDHGEHGSPGDLMGPEPDSHDMSDTMSDVNLDGISGERAKKGE